MPRIEEANQRRLDFGEQLAEAEDGRSNTTPSAKLVFHDPAPQYDSFNQITRRPQNRQ